MRTQFLISQVDHSESHCIDGFMQIKFDRKFNMQWCEYICLKMQRIDANIAARAITPSISFTHFGRRTVPKSFTHLKTEHSFSDQNRNRPFFNHNFSTYTRPHRLEMFAIYFSPTAIRAESYVYSTFNCIFGIMSHCWIAFNMIKINVGNSQFACKL